MNAPQHIIERLIGQLGSKVKSRTLSETQMLNSYHMQLSLQLLHGGVSYGEEPVIAGGADADESGETKKMREWRMGHRQQGLPARAGGFKGPGKSCGI